MAVRLYVGNLSFDATADDLREIFGQSGEVEDAIIVTRPGGGRPRGFGFVTFDSEEAVDKVTTMHYHEINNKTSTSEEIN